MQQPIADTRQWSISSLFNPLMLFSPYYLLQRVLCFLSFFLSFPLQMSQRPMTQWYHRKLVPQSGQAIVHLADYLAWNILCSMLLRQLLFLDSIQGTISLWNLILHFYNCQVVRSEQLLSLCPYTNFHHNTKNTYFDFLSHMSESTFPFSCLKNESFFKTRPRWAHTKCLLNVVWMNNKGYRTKF